MKLLYMIDRSLRRSGLPGLGVKWIRWYYGPYSRELDGEIEELASRREIIAESVATESGVIRVFRPRLGVGGRPRRGRGTVQIPPEVRRIVSSVVEELGSLSFDELMEAVYATFPEGKRLGEEIPLAPD